MPKNRLTLLKRAIQKNKCDTFTLQQRGKTCYGSFDPYVWTRVIPYVSNVEDPIKLYVRRSMANLWDDAQGHYLLAVLGSRFVSVNFTYYVEIL